MCLSHGFLRHSGSVFQQIHNIQAIVMFGQIQGCLALLVLNVPLGALFQEDFDHLLVALVGSVVQRRRPEPVLRINVGLLIQK